MASFNKVMLMGNLTRDPQVKHLPSNTVVAEFGLACNRRYRTAAGEDKEETAFVDCAAFGRQAETIAQHCTKGKPLFVEGRLKYDTWDDKMGQGKRSKLSVVVENFQFIGAKGANAEDFPADMFAGDREHKSDRPAKGRRERAPREEQTEKPVEQPFKDGERQFEEADIPF